ncbi:mechanosensitive ion channel [candidate division TA06 bacterium]|uniref:Mechanosensitive ion channel n=1 Tax=candidate division TA06 bacterium TaxID=2250710 RepID=A0A523UTF2_UNCT6|nr:MAG: mechanosensitive ion channel [candidate division TA06 bacterium]
MLGFKGSALPGIPSFVTGLVIIAVVFVAAYILRRILRRTVRILNIDQRIHSLLINVPFYLVIAMGFLSGLYAMGINVGPILATLGLGGFALGMAFKDVLSNLISGVLILIYRPFDTGDFVSVAGFEGVVKEINLRYTVLDKDEELILIPNSKIYTTPLKLAKAEKKERD